MDWSISSDTYRRMLLNAPKQTTPTSPLQNQPTTASPPQFSPLSPPLQKNTHYTHQTTFIPTIRSQSSPPELIIHSIAAGERENSQRARTCVYEFDWSSSVTFEVTLFSVVNGVIQYITFAWFYVFREFITSFCSYVEAVTLFFFTKFESISLFHFPFCCFSFSLSIPFPQFYAVSGLASVLYALRLFPIFWIFIRILRALFCNRFPVNHFGFQWSAVFMINFNTFAITNELLMRIFVRFFVSSNFIENI